MVLESIAKRGVERWEVSDDAGKQWFIDQYHAEILTSTALNPRYAAHQKLFVTAGSNVKQVMARLSPELNANQVFVNCTLATLLPEEYELALQKKEEMRNNKISNGVMQITSPLHLCEKMRDIAESMTSKCESLESAAGRVTINELMPIGVCLIFATCCRPNEIDPRCCTKDGNIKRRDGEIPTASNFEVCDSYAVIKRNGSKGKAGLPRAPRGIVSLLPPDLLRRMFRVWFAHINNVKLDTKSFNLSWHYNTCGRFKKQFMARFEVDKIVTPINGHNLSVYDVKSWGLMCLDFLHDVTEIATDVHTAVTLARAAQAGHFGSNSQANYSAVRIVDPTGYEPRKKKLKLDNGNLVIA